MAKQKVLVTGGAGFIGSHLARRLCDGGKQVVVLDDLSMGTRQAVPGAAQFIEGDVRSEADVRRALEGVDTVFHEAAKVSIRSSIKEFYADADTNFMGTLNLLRGCAGAGVRRLVFASSMAVYADSPTPDPIDEDYTTEPAAPYGIAKLAAEKYCLQLAREAGIDCHVLRYFNTYGIGQTYTPYVGVITIFIRRLLNGEHPVIFGDGEQKRDFVHVSDIVAANCAAMEAPGKYGIYNVGTGRATSVNELARILIDLINPELAAEHVAAHPGELRYSIANIERARTLLGYQPGGVLEERLPEVVDFYRK